MQEPFITTLHKSDAPEAPTAEFIAIVLIGACIVWIGAFHTVAGAKAGTRVLSAFL